MEQRFVTGNGRRTGYGESKARVRDRGERKKKVGEGYADGARRGNLSRRHRIL